MVCQKLQIQNTTYLCLRCCFYEREIQNFVMERSYYKMTSAAVYLKSLLTTPTAVCDQIFIADNFQPIISTGSYFFS